MAAQVPEWPDDYWEHFPKRAIEEMRGRELTATSPPPSGPTEPPPDADPLASSDLQKSG